MALTNIEKVRLQTGDRVEPYFVSDEEIDAYLEDYGNNIRSVSVQVAQNILFQLGANPSIYRERTGDEEVFTSDAFKSYKEALLLYIKYPHMFLRGIMPYCAGLTDSDKSKYKNNPDINLAGAGLPRNSNDTKNIIKGIQSFDYSEVVQTID